MSPTAQPPGASGAGPGSVARLLPTDPSSIAGYRLLGRLGAGGMGVVYLGRTETGELAAVKVTHTDRDDADFRARFRREVTAARRVTSPWAVPVTAADPDAPEPWLATAFVPGPSLAEAVAAHGPLPTRSVRVLGVALAAALAAVHRAGLVHRDVKPGNVLLAVDGPRLIDFGIARTTEETALTATDMVVGTPGFLAPEQAEARGAEIGPPSDVFALGCLLAYAVTGRLPFGRGAVDALLYRTVHDEPDLTGIDGALAAVLGECLAKAPGRRPTADEVAARLAEDTPGAGADWLPPDVVRIIAERSARMLALPDIEPTRIGETAEPTPRGRRAFLLASGGAVLAAGGGGVALWAGRRGGDESTTGAPRGRRWIIGVQADLTGPQRHIGIEQERGARLAVEAFNDRVGNAFTLELKTADDAGNTTRASAAARSLTGDRDVLAVLGSTGDYTTESALPVYDEALLPLMSDSAGLNTLTTGQNRVFTRACPTHAVAALQLSYVLQMYYRHLKRASARPGLLQDRTDDNYAWQYIAMTNHALRVNYGHRTHPRVVPASVRSYDTVIGEMVDAGIDSYVHGGGPRSAAKAAIALKARGFTGLTIAGQHVLSPEFLKLAGDAAEGWLIGAPVAEPTRVATAKGFVAAYRKKFGTGPGFYAGESFDCVNMMIEEVVKGARGGRRPARQDLGTALRQKSYQGVMGSYQFQPKGDLKGLGTYLFKVDKGRFSYVNAAPTDDPGRLGKA
ncbi:bifunctional serine/threonine-protein kinase/ABC transporter substrate-binding protein [Streptomyces sp. NPDC020965]|uniref:bifunctional serine/threonine-protein kinase/ABC transporter substrate-binding protein n=1 Tax=Streptomyces sp. NPDC020965 TaxID=3365105 RepID=UPI00379697E6